MLPPSVSSSLRSVKKFAATRLARKKSLIRSPHTAGIITSKSPESPVKVPVFVVTSCHTLRGILRRALCNHQRTCKCTSRQVTRGKSFLLTSHVSFCYCVRTDCCIIFRCRIAQSLLLPLCLQLVTHFWAFYLIRYGFNFPSLV